MDNTFGKTNIDYIILHLHIVFRFSDKILRDFSFYFIGLKTCSIFCDGLVLSYESVRFNGIEDINIVNG